MENSEKLTVWVRPDTRQQLEAWAEGAGVSRSDAIRIAINKLIHNGDSKDVFG